MARASYIYTVTPVAGYVPQATFTVKHEMVTWMKGFYNSPKAVKVHRYPDGGPRDENEHGSLIYRTELDVEELWED